MIRKKIEDKPQDIVVSRGNSRQKSTEKWPRFFRGLTDDMPIFESNGKGDGAALATDER